MMELFLSVILAVSVTVNVYFIGGYIANKIKLKRFRKEMFNMIDLIGQPLEDYFNKEKGEDK